MQFPSLMPTSRQVNPSLMLGALLSDAREPAVPGRRFFGGGDLGDRDAEGLRARGLAAQGALSAHRGRRFGAMFDGNEVIQWRCKLRDEVTGPPKEWSLKEA